MSDLIGSRFGAFEITGPLGAGGMGEVYRARDTRLKREVALKVLPVTFAADPDRVARFQREAELLATLSHPHIAAVYGLEESASEDGRVTRALVMELVDGETLAERLNAGPIPAIEVLDLARQLADALDYAHEHGVLHRDLKPANLKLTSPMDGGWPTHRTSPGASRSTSARSRMRRDNWSCPPRAGAIRSGLRKSSACSSSGRAPRRHRSMSWTTRSRAAPSFQRRRDDGPAE